jgi:hypothetical protein
LRYRLAEQFSCATELPNGGSWAPRDVATYTQNAGAHSAQAVFERREALVQLARLVNVRKSQPDLGFG